jgi:branched-chain amino acid transport system substrate-binding protein
LIVQRIIETLKTEIMDGGIPTGGRLPSERELQVKHRAGRGTIREALKTMEGMGIIKIRKGRGGGAFVTREASLLTSCRLYDLPQAGEDSAILFCGFRRMLEPGMAKLAALYRSEEDLKDIRASLDTFANIPHTRQAFAAVNQEFFQAVCRATHNIYAVTFYTHQVLPVLTESAAVLYDTPQCVEKSMYYFTQMADAVSQRDAMRSEMIADVYLVEMERLLKKAKDRAMRSKGRSSDINWGVILDLSSMTMDYGQQNAMGMIDAARYLNENGGIHGRRLNLFIHDDQYQAAEGKQAYLRFRDQHKVLGIFIQPTGSNLLVAPMAMQDGVFMLSGAPTERLSNPREFPYYFFFGPTYTDLVKIAIKYMVAAWQDVERPPKLVFLYPDNPYGHDPLIEGRRFATSMGVEVGPDQVIDWPTVDATRQMRALAAYKADYAYIASTAMNTAHMLGDARRLGLATRFIGNQRVTNEDLPRLALQHAEGFLGVQPFALYGAQVPGMAMVVKEHDRWHPYHHPNQVYVEGWAFVRLIAYALRQADEAGRLNAAGLKEALESLKEFDLGGLTPPVTFSPTRHCSTNQASMYEVKGGRFQLLASSLAPDSLVPE